METYCVSFKEKYFEQKCSVRRARQNKLITVSNCAICGKKKSRFIKNQETGRLLSKLGIITLSNNIPLISGSVF